VPSALFIYGTLLDARVFARLAGRAPLRRAMPARARGFTRVILRGTPYPTLRRADATAVDGLLLPRLGNDARRRLAAYEGASYRLAPIRVVTRRGPRFARAWLAPAWRAAQLPWAPLRARM
jgi:hypothetical protein